MATTANPQEVKVKKSLKDLKSVEEFNFEDVELIRGEAPKDIKEKCLKLCKDYLSKSWEQQTLDTISFRRLSGGMTNQLYYCALNDNCATNESDVKEVAIRLYGPKWFNNLDNNGNVMKNERLTDVIIALMVSQNKLGPKIHGIFENGQIQQFYEHRQFRLEEQNNAKLSTQLFGALARVHAMDVPLRKTSSWLFEFFDDYYTKGMNGDTKKLIDELNCETFKKHDLKTELEWLKKTVVAINSPIVFCHNDFRGSNIMVTKNNNNSNDEIVLCDFEYSCYGYRGFDLGTILVEWGRAMNDVTKLHDFPEDSAIESLLQHYIDESVRICGQKYLENKNNSMDQLLREVKLFVLIGNIFFILFGIQNDDNNEQIMDKKVMMGFSDICFKNYFHLKNQFVAQNIF